MGGLIAYGCVDGQKKSRHPTMASWQIMALCLGLVSIVYGACMWYLMAGSVVTTKFSEEKTLAVERLKENHQGIGSHQFKW
jgi:ACS family allantoate permease-like MFS transporter